MSEKPNFLRKAEVLSNGDYDNFRFTRQTLNSEYQHIPISEENPFPTIDDALAYDAWKMENDSENWKECKRLDHARIARVCRLKERVKYMLAKGTCIFVTLTFSPEVLERTSAKTRHDYVNRWLKRFPSAIANLDFGGQSGREHYHAVVRADTIDLSTWEKYGYIFAKRIPLGDANNADKLARYVSKLVNHAIKQTTKGCRTIYSGYFGVGTPKDHVPKWVDENIRQPFREEPFVSEGEFMKIPDDLLKELEDLFM